MYKRENIIDLQMVKYVKVLITDDENTVELLRSRIKSEGKIIKAYSYRGNSAKAFPEKPDDLSRHNETEIVCLILHPTR